MEFIFKLVNIDLDFGRLLYDYVAEELTLLGCHFLLG